MLEKAAPLATTAPQFPQALQPSGSYREGQFLDPGMNPCKACKASVGVWKLGPLGLHLGLLGVPPAHGR